MTKHLLILGLIGLTLSSLPLFAQTNANLPQVADGGGIRTTFIFFGNGASASTVVLTLTKSDGTPMTINIPGLNATGPGVYLLMINPGETRFFQSDGQSPALQVGSATVVATGDIGVSAIFSLFAGNTLLTEAGVGASDGLTEFAIAVDTMGTFNTGVAVQDLSGSANNLNVSLFDSDGNSQVATLGAGAIALPGMGQRARFVEGGLFPGLGDFRGKGVFTADSQVAAVTLRQNLPSGAPLTTLPVVPTDSNQTVFNLPQVANGLAGAIGIKTQFVAFVLGSQPANVTFDLTRDDGTPFVVGLADPSPANSQSGSSFSFEIAGDGALFFETDGLGSLVAGAATVTSDVPIGVSAVFRLLDAQGNVTTEAGVGDSPAFSSFSLPVDLTSGFNTGVAFFNNNDGTANLDIDFIDQGGQVLAESSLQLAPQTLSFPLAPFNHTARFVDGATGGNALFPELDGDRGMLAVTSDLDISAVGLRQSTPGVAAAGGGGESTLTTLPVAEGVADVNGGGPGPGPVGTELLETVLDDVSITGNTVLNQELDLGLKLSGQVMTPGNFIVSGGVVAVRDDGRSFSGSTDFFGNYQVILEAGTYDVRVCTIQTQLPPLATPHGIGGILQPSSTKFVGHVERDVVVNGDTNRNITTDPAGPDRLVSGVVSNLNSLPPDTLALGISLVFSPQDSRTTSLAQVDPATGAYQANLESGAYTAGLFFAQTGAPTTAGQSFEGAASLYNIGQVNVGGGPTTANFSVPPLVTLSGTVSQPQTPVLPDDTLAVALDFSFPFGTELAQCFPGVGGSFSPAGGSGDYELTLLANRSYDPFGTISVPGTGPAGFGQGNEGTWNTPLFGTATLSLSTDSDLDFIFPVFPDIFILSGKVTDPDGLGVAGVDVDASTPDVIIPGISPSGGVSGAPNTFFQASTQTDSLGNYELGLFRGTGYQIVFDPPANLAISPFEE